MIVGIALASLLSVHAQTKRTSVRRPPQRSAAPAQRTTVASSVPRGSVVGRTYTNKALGFEVTFPDTWLIADDDYYAYMKKHGFDLTPKPPKALSPTDQVKVNADFNRLKILLTVYRSLPGTEGNAIASVATENVKTLDTTRPVKDAVDYVDLWRSQKSRVKMPPDFKYSETQAEKLGNNQFAFIDYSDKSGKRRLYVMVRGGYALLFSLAYTADEDLETFRDTLARANFSLK